MADEVRWLDDREQCAWRSFIELQARLNARLSRDLQESSGLSSADFAVLVPLSEHADGRVRVLELARLLQWEKSRLSHQLTRMQQRGMLTRTQCDDDRRGAWIVLTDAGRKAVETAAPSHVETVRRYFFDALSSEQVDALRAISSAAIDRLTAVADESCDSGVPDGCGADGVRPGL